MRLFGARSPPWPQVWLGVRGEGRSISDSGRFSAGRDGGEVLLDAIERKTYRRHRAAALFEGSYSQIIWSTPEIARKGLGADGKQLAGGQDWVEMEQEGKKLTQKLALVR